MRYKVTKEQFETLYTVYDKFLDEKQSEYKSKGTAEKTARALNVEFEDYLVNKLYLSYTGFIVRLIIKFYLGIKNIIKFFV